MKTRIALVFIAWMSVTSAHAALWQVESVDNGSIFATFDHTPGGTYSNLTAMVFGNWESFYAGVSPTSDSQLTAWAGSNPLYLHLAMDFTAPLTAAGGIIAVSYIGVAWDGNYCRGDGSCLEWGPGSYIARSVAELPEIPVPASFWLVVAALPVLAFRGRWRQHLPAA